GRQTRTVYYDAAHAVVTDVPNSNAPMSASREDRARAYNETYTVPAGTAFTESGENLTFTLNGQPVMPLSLSRTLYNPAGQRVAERTYFSFAGLSTYSPALTFGTAWSPGSGGGNYYETTLSYDEMGRESREVSPTGTITRTVYDAEGRVVSTWVGTND